MTPVRAQFARCILICIALASCANQASIEPTEPPSAPEIAKPAVSETVGFLQSLFDPEIGLMAMSDTGSMEVDGTEYSFSRIFWIYSDNFLASKALEPFDPPLSRALTEEIEGFDLPLPGYWEALFCEEIPEPPRVAKPRVVEKGSDYIILTEDHNEVPPLEGNYADVLIYRAINLRDEDLFEQARLMWDGIGVRDDATEADGLYASYKLALLLIGASVLRADLPERAEIQAQLWSMQQEDGGITTFYDLTGDPQGTASTETTSLAILSTAPPWHCED